MFQIGRFPQSLWNVDLRHLLDDENHIENSLIQGPVIVNVRTGELLSVSWGCNVENEKYYMLTSWVYTLSVSIFLMSFFEVVYRA